FSLSFFFSFLGCFANGRQALDRATFIEFAFGNGAWCWVSTDNEELLSDGPEVGCCPVDQYTNWEVETTDGKDCWQRIEHDFLRLCELSGLCRLGHVLTHQGLLHVEHGGDHQNNENDGDDDDIQVKVFANVVLQNVRHLGAGERGIRK